ncbi:MAG: hypothetical protein NWP69_02040 [Congregibacter sp.]|nr:hypothetical protein [Congregibacter sp.]
MTKDLWNSSTPMPTPFVTLFSEFIGLESAARMLMSDSGFVSS